MGAKGLSPCVAFERMKIAHYWPVVNFWNNQNPNLKNHVVSWTMCNVVDWNVLKVRVDKSSILCSFRAPCLLREPWFSCTKVPMVFHLKSLPWLLSDSEPPRGKHQKEHAPHLHSSYFHIIMMDFFLLFRQVLGILQGAFKWAEGSGSAHFFFIKSFFAAVHSHFISLMDYI